MKGSAAQVSEDLIVGYYCHSLGTLASPSEVVKALATLLGKVKFTGVRYAVTSTSDEFAKFVSAAQHPFEMPIET